jgi:hypothetical protein
VYKAIQRAIDKIAALHEPLGRHLQDNVKTGSEFAYYRPSDTPPWK